MIGTGLLDFLKTPAGQGLLATGLGVAANAGRGGTWNALGRGGMAGLLAYNQAQEGEALASERAKTGQLRDMQIDNYKAEVASKNKALEADARKRAVLPTLYGAGTGAGGAGLDWRRALESGFSPQEIQNMAGLENIGRQEVARTVEVDDGNGGKATVQLDKFGQPIGNNLPGYVAPVQVNQGDRVSFVRPAAGVALPVGMSPAERDASARGWAGVANQRAQLAQGQTQVLNDPNQGPQLVNKVTGISTPIRGQDGAPLQSEAMSKQVTGARKALEIIDKADKLIDSATGSYVGAGVDQAFRAFGSTTKGAEATAKLKALEGSLMMAQPRMEGPQSNMDVQLYRQMAGQIGDPTVPNETKKAALATIRELHDRYANPGQPKSKGGASGGWSIQKVN